MAVVINGTTGITAPGTETFGDGTALGGATNPIVSMAKGANNYVQGYIVNNTDAANSSADLVCYPSNGTDSSGWIDMGITGPTFSQAAYGITGANEGYIFMSAPSGAIKTGNLVLATDSTGTQNAIKFATGGFGSTTERMRIDASGNVGIGTSSPTSVANYKTLNINGTTGGIVYLQNNGTNVLQISGDGSSVGVAGLTAIPMLFSTNNAERMRIDSSGNLLVGTTSVGIVNSNNTQLTPSGYLYANHVNGTASNTIYAGFGYNGSFVGSISQNGTTGVLYNITSDYRLKNDQQPLTGAKEFVMALQPKKWQWWDGSGEGVGFIAHEFMEVAKYSGHGEKDAVDEEGKIIAQSIQPSSSEVMANLVSLLQEQQAIITQLQADVAKLKAANA